jgi:endonuclease YncB( thermonuclease family)
MYQYNCIIKRVVDGDTIIADIDLGFSTWLKDVSIRVLGVDAPETRTKDIIEKIEGLKSKARVEQLLPVGSTVVVRTVIDKEKFGRILGDFLIDGKESLGHILLAEGLAKSYLV